MIELTENFDAVLKQNFNDNICLVPVQNELMYACTQKTDVRNNLTGRKFH